MAICLYNSGQIIGTIHRWLGIRRVKPQNFFDVFYPETLGDMIPGECAYFSGNGWRKSHQPEERVHQIFHSV